MSEQERRTSGHVGHETRDVTFRPVIGFTLGIVGLMIIAFVGMFVLERGLEQREARRPAFESPLRESFARRQPPAPRLQAEPLRDLEELHRLERSILDSYGWIDRDAGRVRIPIERAMQLIAERGVPEPPPLSSGGGKGDS